MSAADGLTVDMYNAGLYNPPQLLRDPSAWYHLVVVFDTTQAAQSNRIKVYINNKLQSGQSFGAGYPAQNGNLAIGQTFPHYIGKEGPTYGGTSYFDGQISQFYYVDGQSLDPTAFGAFDSVTGQWQPIPYGGTYGTNGFYLNFFDPTNLGGDAGSQGNNWTPNNISTSSGSTYDPMYDSMEPMSYLGLGLGNYATMNPLGVSALTLSSGNLDFGNVTWNNQAQGTVGVTSGKWYFEWRANPGGGSYTCVGIAKDTVSLTADCSTADIYTNYQGYRVFMDGTLTALTGVNNGYDGATHDFAIAVDLDAGKLWTSVDGTWANGGNPSAGTGGFSISAGDLGSTFVPYAGPNKTSGTPNLTINFGQRPFTYTVPTGFLPLNTFNLPAPTIITPTTYVSAITYIGTGAAQTISGFTVTPSLIFLKDLTSANAWGIYDTERADVTPYLSTNTTAGDIGAFSGLTSFDANGFSLGKEAAFNTSANNYISWNWKEGATQGFDIVTYTGTGANRTIAHSLGTSPTFVIVKRTDNTGNWPAWHQNMTSPAYYALMNTTGIQTSGPTYWNSTSPTSSVFSVGTSTDTNASGASYVAYLFSEVPGYSKFGTYTGNGAADGPFIYTGFKPAWFFYHRVDAGSSWQIVDNARNPFNPLTYGVVTETNGADFTAAGYLSDFVSNGIKIRGAGANLNTSGATYIYVAFAEAPFKEISVPSATTISASLRFESGDSAYLRRSVASTGSRTTWTVSAWVKRHKLAAVGNILASYNGAAPYDLLRFNTSDELEFVVGNQLGTANTIVASGLYRDPSKWYHVVGVWDTTNATAADRIRLYVDGQRISSFSTSLMPTQNTATSVFTLSGRNADMSLFNGVYSSISLADYYFIDGAALDASSFGETNQYGYWVPKAYSGSYGTNGFHLDFSDQSNVGKDVAGSNNWTPTNFQTSNDLPLRLASDGYIVNTTSTVLNGNAATYVGWAWDESTTAGLDIVSYAGTGANTTVSHNLGNAPEFMIVKRRDTTGNWAVWHQNMTSGAYYQLLNTSAAQTSGATYWNSTTPTSSVFSVGTSTDTNASGGNYVAYLFSEVPGYSKFGTYTGNGAADGAFVYTGFKPAYVMVKRTDTTGDWYVWDTARDAVNPAVAEILADTTAAEAATADLDLLSNGFKLRATTAGYNASGGTYIYAAFAESPFREISAPASANVSTSLRFNNAANAYLTRTPAGAGNRQTMTMSMWVKRGKIDSGTTLYGLFGSFDGASTFDYVAFYQDTLSISFANATRLRSTQIFRDPSAWYHVVISIDTTQATAANRIRAYVNGQEITGWSTNSQPAQNTNSARWNTAVPNLVGTYYAPNNYYDGYMADVYFIDGQQLTPSSFGEYNQHGYWVPKAYSGSYGTNGFHLEFKDKSNTTAATLGADTSGNGNNWTPTNLSVTAGAGDDVLRDTPTNYNDSNGDHGNFATLNPLALGGTLSDGNLAVTAATSHWRMGTIALPTGKWYWEMNATTTATGGYPAVGLWRYPSAYTGAYLGANTNGIAFYTTRAIYRNSAIQTTLTGTNVSNGDIVSVAFDADTGKIWFARNGTWYNSGDPAAGSNEAISGLTEGDWAPSIGVNNNGVGSVNFGQRPFSYAPPSGFKAVNTLNMPSSTIVSPSMVFSPTLYTGNATSQTISGLSFSPDLVWVKSRSGAYNHALFDSVRSTASDTPYLSSNLTNGDTRTYYPYDNDLLRDTPTNYLDSNGDHGNFATLNPLDKTAAIALSDGNLTIAYAIGSNARATHFLSAGKFYWEYTYISVSGNTALQGVCTNRASLSQYPGLDAYSWTYYGFNGTTLNNSVSGGTYSTVVAGDIGMVAIDMDNGKIWFGKNGAWFNSGAPASGTGAVFSNLAGQTVAACAGSGSPAAGGGAINFGQRPFSYTPPSGFKAVNTLNLTSSTITSPTQYFKPVTYTGTGAAVSVTGLSFTPDLVWIKDRTTTNAHGLFDRFRALAKPYLSSNATTGNTYSSSGVTDISQTGFAIGTNSLFNTSGNSYLALAFNEGTTPGFDIVTYTGTGANRTISHGLGSAAEMAIVKRLDSTGNWAVYHKNLTSAANYLLLNSTAIQAAGATYWNSTAPTSSVFSVGTHVDTNASGGNYVAYLFSSVDGFSRIGSYTGNGSANGPFVYTGFRPSFVIIKRATSAVADWVIFDGARTPYNPVINYSYLDTNGAQNAGGASTGIDFLANGFKLRGTEAATNASGHTYVYAAFAEAPFKYSNAR